MKNPMKYLIIVIAAALATAGSASASGVYGTNTMNPNSDSEYFEGKFSGFVYGDRASKARIHVEMSQDVQDVNALVTIEEGLYIDAGICGASFLPAGEQSAHTTVQMRNPRVMSTTLVFKVKSQKVSVDLSGEVSADGKKMDTKAVIDLPWICGRDPVIQGTLYRIQ